MLNDLTIFSVLAPSFSYPELTLDLPPFIVTLGALTVLRGAAFLVANGTTVINRDLNFAWIGNNYLGFFPWLVVIRPPA